jgi:hypothetical protein
MMEFLVEQRIAEAIARGELDDLPGAGRPLDLDDDAHVPEEMRLAYRILKNAGYAPREVGALNEKLMRLKAKIELLSACRSSRTRRSISSGRRIPRS